jgi:ABC-2 type transport system permease protein
VNTVTLTLSQVRYVNKAFWRNPSSAFFTFAFPLMFLVIFTALLGNNKLHIGTMTVKASTYYVASMGAFAVITASYNNLAIGVSFQRDEGVLKRIHGTPLPSSAYLGARVLHSLYISVVLVVITALFGHGLYHARLPTGAPLFQLAVMLVVGGAAFSALGLAVTGLVPNADAAPAIVNATILPLEFLSGIFIPFTNNTPQWIVWVARIFPVRHFVVALQAAFLGTKFQWTDVLIVAAWGLGGLLLGIRYFTWEPRTAA